MKQISETTDKRAAELFLSKIGDAKKRGIPFELTFIQFKNLCNNPFCYYTGKRLKLREKSFERVDSKEGYTFKNTVICRRDLNVFKNNLDPKDLVLMAKAIEKHILKTKQ